VDGDLRRHIAFAQEQVSGFARRQRETLADLEAQTLDGVVLGHRHVPVGAVGAYSPGGRYPLIASAIMTVVVAKQAGVDRVVACAPPHAGAGIHPVQLHAMVTSGADEILCIGGAHAMAAMAAGIEDVAAVDMLVGPGNPYVAEAKRQLFGRVGIDLLAGPTEVVVLADETADPRVVAADLLGQAEHGPTSPVALATTSRALAEATIAAVDQWLESWPTADVAGAAWREFGAVLLCEDDAEMAVVCDDLAPEHVQVQTRDPDWFLRALRNYGSLFLGSETTVAYGDKAVGTNHVLPTAGAARYTGGLWVGKFLKTLTYQRMTPAGVAQIAPSAAAICDAEHMLGHAITARLRLS
jgi:sulfopropanediol 3-dehydrogenase